MKIKIWPFIVGSLISISAFAGNDYRLHFSVDPTISSTFEARVTSHRCTHAPTDGVIASAVNANTPFETLWRTSASLKDCGIWNADSYIGIDFFENGKAVARIDCNGSNEGGHELECGDASPHDSTYCFSSVPHDASATIQLKHRSSNQCNVY